MQNKAFYSAIACVSLVAIWWLSASNTDDASLSESADDPGSSLSKNVKTTTAPEVFYSPPAAVKSKPVDNLRSPLATQPQALGEAADESMRESHVPGDDFAPGSEEVVSAEPDSEYIQREETEIKNAYSETANPPTENPEMQTLAQQLQAMRDTGLNEAVVREVEEKLIELQRLQDQQTISKANAEDVNADSD